MNFKKAKIALVFDWMTSRGGAEKVNLQLHKLFPEAPIFCSIFDHQRFPEFKDAKIHTSFIQKLPFAQKKHQIYLSLMPYAYEQFNLSQFDIVISSSHACAKGIITKPETLHISYCHSPMRYAWDNWHNYIKQYKMNPLLKAIGKHKLHKIRIWDRLSADRVDHFIANSSITAARIKKYYGKDSQIIFPMVETEQHSISKEKENYFLAVGRLVPNKKFDLIIDTFNKNGLPLKIAGTGVSEKHLKARAKENIQFLGYTSNKELRELYSKCQAYIFPQLEDFGITAIEAMASGTPVIAYRAGGALDSVIEGKTGIFFEEQSPEALSQAIKEFQSCKKVFQAKEICEHAKQFNHLTFQENILKFVEEKWAEKKY